MLNQPSLFNKRPEVMSRAIAESGDLACLEAIKAMLPTSGAAALTQSLPLFRTWRAATPCLIGVKVSWLQAEHLADEPLWRDPHLIH